MQKAWVFVEKNNLIIIPKKADDVEEDIRSALIAERTENGVRTTMWELVPCRERGAVRLFVRGGDNRWRKQDSVTITHNRPERLLAIETAEKSGRRHLALYWVRLNNRQLAVDADEGRLSAKRKARIHSEARDVLLPEIVSVKKKKKRGKKVSCHAVRQPEPKKLTPEEIQKKREKFRHYYQKAVARGKKIPQPAWMQ